MFTGLRQGDVLTLKKNAVREGHIWRVTDNTGLEVSLPVHPDRAKIIAAAPGPQRYYPSCNIQRNPLDIGRVQGLFQQSDEKARA